MSWLLWSRMAPPACTGGVFIEFRPPLTQPGPYQFTLALNDSPPRCQFEVALPADKPISTSRCGMRLELQTRGAASDASIVGLTVGKSPKKLHLIVKRGVELIYDSRIAPAYAAEPTTRKESKYFCGERASISPQCIRGTSQCTPFSAACDGPEDCPAGKICCVSPESGHEYGYKSASQCASRAYCIGRLAHIACHTDEDCPKDMSCTDTSLETEFKPAIRGCRGK
jgi:hypothetical protein